MRCIALAGGITLLVHGVALGYQPLVTDDTGTQGRGANQIELAYNRTVEKLFGERAVTHDLPVVFTRGLTDALDLFVGIAHQRLTFSGSATEEGWSNPTFGAKWRFFEDDDRKLSVALKPALFFPVSESRERRGLGTARTSFGMGLLVTQETRFGAVHGNAVVERVNYADDALNAAERRTRYRFSVAPVWDVAQGWKIALDAGIVTNPDRSARSSAGYVELGGIYSPNADLDLAIGIIRNVRDGAISTTLATIGLTWRFR